MGLLSQWFVDLSVQLIWLLWVRGQGVNGVPGSRGECRVSQRCQIQCVSTRLPSPPPTLASWERWGVIHSMLHPLPASQPLTLTLRPDTPSPCPLKANPSETATEVLSFWKKIARTIICQNIWKQISLQKAHKICLNNTEDRSRWDNFNIIYIYTHQWGVV